MSKKNQLALELKCVYSVNPTRPFLAEGDINYVIDLPIGEWGESAIVKSDLHLNDGDMIKLPNGSWLKISIDKEQCFGYEGSLFGLLEVMTPSDDIKKDIQNKKAVGKVYTTAATYLR